MSFVDVLLSRQPILRRLLAALLLAILGIIDVTTGYEYSFAVFYLLPVAIIAWYDNKVLTVITIWLSAIVWLVADLSAGHPYSNEVIPFWNALVRLGFFTIVALLLRRTKNALLEVTALAMQDSLTSLNNARSFDIQYKVLRELSIRKRGSLAVGVIDLDGFKAVNDKFGHRTGDEVLSEFARILKNVTRNSDVIARLGGDEFAVILPCTDKAGASAYDARLRYEFAQSHIKRIYSVDFSMGIFVFTAPPVESSDATTLADELMYKSKALGKSQTTYGGP